MLPKDLIVLKIAQKQAELAKRVGRNQHDRLYQSLNRESRDSIPDSNKLYLPTLPGSITSRHQSIQSARFRTIEPDQVGKKSHQDGTL